MKTINVDEITVEVYRETIRARMYKTALFATAIAVLEELAQEMGISKRQVSEGLADFGAIAPRIKVVKGKLDFEFPLHSDAPDIFKAKYHKYLDSKYATLIDKIAEAINALDRVQDIDLLPGVVLDDDDKKK